MTNPEPMQVSIDALRALDRLDRGDVAAELARFTSVRSDSADVATELWAAELTLYLDRLDEVESTIKPLERLLPKYLAEDSDLGSLARRRHLIEAELAYFRGAYERANELTNAVAFAAERVRDEQHVTRATFDAGRTLRRRGEYASSLETLLVASHMARRIGNSYYEGMIAYNRAICCYELGDYERLGDYLDAALELLGASENLRFLALSKNLQGLLLTEEGSIPAGMAVFDEAEQTAATLGITSDRMSIANNAARALIAGHKYEEAERRLSTLVADAEDGATMASFYALCMLSVAQSAQAKMREARKSAKLAYALADAEGSEEDRFESGLLLLRARALTGEEPAIDELREALRTADDAGSENHRVQARIYLAQALVAESPIEATSLCREVRSSGSLAAGSWLTSELERVEYLLARAPIRVDEQDRLIIDTKLSWPTVKAAREAAERFIYDRAMEATRGNASAAGRLIGESRYQMHHLGRILRGEAPRPSRSKDPDASQKRPLRRRSRIQFS